MKRMSIAVVETSVTRVCCVLRERAGAMVKRVICCSVAGGGHRRLLGLIASGVVAVAMVCHAGVAQEEQPTLDELLKLPARKAPVQEQPAAGLREAAPDQPLAEQLKRRLEQPAAERLFEKEVEEMDVAAGLLRQHRDPGVRTQRIQESILAKLEQVIKQAKRNRKKSKSQSKAKQQGGQSQNAQPQPGQPQPGGVTPNQGQVSPGSVQSVGQDEGAMGQAGQEWGNLPPRLRQELQQGTREHFSPVYRSMTERYYQRLSQESGQ